MNKEVTDMAITSFKKKDTQFLSNFYPCMIEFEGQFYPSAEHAFQAAKSLDVEERKKYEVIRSASEAKKCGKSENLRPDWETVKIKIMKDILKSKFSRNDLKTQLLSTGDEELIEGNNHGDRFWGQVKGEGCNHLGKLLMEVREEIKNESAC